MERLTTRQPPTGPWKLFFRAPIWLYRLHLGWLLGGRFLLMEHVGRRSGLVRRVVVEVVHHDRDADTYTVASGFGPRSDWYLNLKEHPDIAIRVGRRYLAVRAHFLSADEGADVMERYAREHTKAAPELAKFMGFQVDGSAEDYRAVGREVPFVRFTRRSRPRATA
ncbi:MAG: nitroreductase family deazaflavin-dependent oxidoreductase [Dehalococcoidia bacterium]|nr:nitroreductase family deazaflavin-dependent oxidoreductase [Dehalococcoidia bacterium]MCA9857206.1 nitroreductase family deazaflavin-dependent oxidoreductase [Dehalococcoidia bacterium]MCB9482603.1 nitroreductase family deazaflavin-dependent oxidoreductase [Dehalococcoidia bacterium]